MSRGRQRRLGAVGLSVQVRVMEEIDQVGRDRHYSHRPGPLNLSNFQLIFQLTFKCSKLKMQTHDLPFAQNSPNLAWLQSTSNRTNFLFDPTP
jgi:hypothetical protein